MSIGKILFLNDTKRVNICKAEILSLSTCQNSCALFCIQELTLLVKEFESIPLLRIVRCRKDDTSICLFKHHCHFRCRSGSKTCLHHIHTAGNQRSADKLLHHISGKTGILADNNFISFAVSFRTTLSHLLAVSVSELYNVERRKPLARSAAYGSADAGNGFDQCHIFKFLKSRKIRIL